MSGFQDVTFDWKGQAYTIPATRVLALVARMENDPDLVPANQPLIQVILGAGRPASVALAFEHMLREVQAPFAPGEVYCAIMGDMTEGGADQVRRVQRVALELLAVIAPPVHRRVMGESRTGKKPPAD